MEEFKCSGGDESYLNCSQHLSKRTSLLKNWEDFLLKYMNICTADEYDAEHNVDGYINLGTAVNNICNDILIPKITHPDVWQCDTSLLQYEECHGIPRLRKAMANLMTEFFKTREPVSPDDLFCVVGVTSCIDLLAHCLADAGDVIMAPTPSYGRIYTDLLQRSLVKMWPIPIISKECSEVNPELTLEKVKSSYFEAKEKGENVKAIILLNPSNPLGDVYSVELIHSILEFCHEVKIHVIMDELYALSTFDEGSDFHSVLSFESLPDPLSTHVLYGLSKDFSLAGLRIGAIHTKNADLQKCLLQLTMFQVIPFPIMAIAANFMEDLVFCRNFIAINQKRLRDKFQFCKTRLEEMGAIVRNSKAGVFLWISLREKCNITTFDRELIFFHYLVKLYHLYIVPGKEMFNLQPGWFRLSFAGKPDHVSEGLNRLELAIKNFMQDTKYMIEQQTVPDDSITENIPLEDTVDIEIKYKSDNKDGEEEQEEEKEDDDDKSGLENLVALLRSQIIESNWLSQNTPKLSDS